MLVLVELINYDVIVIDEVMNDINNSVAEELDMAMGVGLEARDCLYASFWDWMALTMEREGSSL